MVLGDVVAEETRLIEGGDVFQSPVEQIGQSEAGPVDVIEYPEFHGLGAPVGCRTLFARLTPGRS